MKQSFKLQPSFCKRCPVRFMANQLTYSRPKEFFEQEFSVVFNNGPNSSGTISSDYFIKHYRELIVRYISDGNPSEDSKRSYFSAIDGFLIWCSAVGMPPMSIEEQHIFYYRSMLIAQNYKPATIKFKLNAVRRFYFVAQKYRLIEINPAKDVKAKKDPDALLPINKYLTAEQLQTLVDSFDETAAEALRTKTIVYLMAIEGLRTVEVHRMNFEDINFASQAIYIRGKGHNDFIYPTPDTMKYLSHYLNSREALADELGTPVFVSTSNNSRGRRLSRQAIRSDIDKALANAGFKAAGNSCHMLRHTCGTLLYAETLDLQVVKNVLRHRSVEMTSKYSHIQDPSARRYTGIIPIRRSSD